MIHLFDNLETLSRAAAGMFAQLAQQSIQEHGRFSVALSGGSTPQRTFELLAAPPWRERVPWESVHVFWSDERCVPPADSRSNEGMARRLLLDHVEIPPGQIYGAFRDGAPEANARRYEELVREFFANQPPCFDLVIQGLGEDAHTASLFPGSPALEETERWVVSVLDAAHELPRVTFTAPLINRAKMIVFLVSGPAKAPALARTLESADAPTECPAKLIHPECGTLDWLVDHMAASALKVRP